MNRLKLRDWQDKAYLAWLQNDCKGTIEASTGSGKSFLFLQAIFDNQHYKVLIVVPTQHLMYQHKRLIMDQLGVANNDIGLIGDGYRQIDKNITIAVINSIRTMDLRDFDVLILDECHHYFSEVNSLIFNNTFDQYMLLSATVDRQDGAEKGYLKSFPIIYRLPQKKCIEQGLLNRFSIINYGLDLTPEERKEYNKTDSFIKENFKNYGFDLTRVMASLRRDSIARHLLRCISKRKSIINNSIYKVIAASKLITDSPTIKTIVFGEYIKTAKEVYRLVNKFCRAGLYHSKLTLKAKEEILTQFRDGRIDVLISVKALDEGLDVPSCERAIIIGGSSTQRQSIQRIGRILRKSGLGKSRLIQFYIKDSKDVDWTRQRIKYLTDAADEVIWR